MVVNVPADGHPSRRPVRHNSAGNDACSYANDICWSFARVPGQATY